MDPQQFEQLKIAFQLLDDFKDASKRQQILQTLFYKERPVLSYFSYLNWFSSAYGNSVFTDAYKRNFKTPPGNNPKYWSKFIPNIESYIDECSKATGEKGRLLNHIITTATSGITLSPNQLDYLQQLQSMPAGARQLDMIDYFIKHIKEGDGKDYVFNPKDVNYFKTRKTPITQKVKNPDTGEEVTVTVGEKVEYISPHTGAVLGTLLPNGNYIDGEVAIKIIDNTIQYIDKNGTVLATQTFGGQVTQEHYDPKENNKYYYKKVGNYIQVIDRKTGNVTAWVPVSDFDPEKTGQFITKEKEVKKKVTDPATGEVTIVTEKVVEYLDPFTGEVIATKDLSGGYITQEYNPKQSDNYTYEKGEKYTLVKDPKTGKIIAWLPIEEETSGLNEGEQSATEDTPEKSSGIEESQDFLHPVVIQASNNEIPKSTVPVEAINSAKKRISSLTSNKTVQEVASEASHQATMAGIKTKSKLWEMINRFLMGFFGGFIFGKILSTFLGGESVTSQRAPFYLGDNPNYYGTNSNSAFTNDLSFFDRGSGGNQQSEERRSPSNGHRPLSSRVSQSPARTLNSMRNKIDNLRKTAQRIQKAIKAIRTTSMIVSFLVSPPGLIIMGIFLVVFGIVFFLWNRNGALCFPTCGSTEEFIPQSTLSLVKSGPTYIDNSTPTSPTFINYEITATYTGSGTASAEIRDRIPAGTAYVSSDPQASNDSGVLVWKLNTLQPGLPQKIKFTVSPVKQDFWAVNQAQGSLTSISGSGIAANDNDCGNTSYRYYMDMTFQTIGYGKNFGDPACTLSKPEDKSKLYSLLQSLDPADADIWFYVIIPCESNYIPLAYYADSPDAAGAWGLFQMGRGLNGQYDHGDIDWPEQVSNAVNYREKVLQGRWNYWQCARGIWDWRHQANNNLQNVLALKKLGLMYTNN